MNWPFSSTPRKAAASWGISGSYSARTSTSGIAMRPNFSLRSPPIRQIRRSEHDEGRDGELDVAEVVIEAVVVRPEAVARAGERERPNGGANRRVDRVRSELHLEDAGRDGDERADERSDAADQDADVPPALEPPLGLVELRGREMEPAAVALEERPSAVPSYRPA